jgi:hypothetical protein
MCDWQPIETAPEGETILIWCGTFEIPRIGHFKDGYWWGGDVVREPSVMQRKPADIATYWAFISSPSATPIAQTTPLR